MEPTNASGTPTHTCLYCNGVWISRESLNGLLAREGKFGSLLGPFRDQSYALAVRKRCPTCPATPLHLISSGDIEIDVCVSCEGMF
jgi:Zn-finger nucleic acid-binding protein